MLISLWSLFFPASASTVVLLVDSGVERISTPARLSFSPAATPNAVRGSPSFPPINFGAGGAGGQHLTFPPI